jgi:O-acetyl-ADP-ribose deacetylase (regulator of RNase III)
MARVRELGLDSVAFPALGTGVGGFPLAEAAQIAVDAVRDELRTPSSIENVIFALRGAAAYQAFALALSAGEPAPSRPVLPAAGRPVGPGEPEARQDETHVRGRA